MTDLLSIVVLLLAATLLVTLVLHRLRAPTLVGYILVGILLGPTGLGVLHESASLELLAEIGVVFLMFYVGLEFSLPVLWASRRAVFGVGGAQVGVTAALGTAAAMALGVPLLPAVLLGGAVAMSSTAITIRQLADQGELGAPHGRVSVGTLLFQDLVTLPFLVLVAALGADAHGGHAEEGAEGADGASPDHALAAAPDATATVGSEVWVELAARLGVAVLAFALALLIGRRLLVGIVGHVHRTGSRELFMLAMLLIVIGAARGAHEVGLSPPLGAFLAGMILGETELKHDAEEDVRPFRDVLLGLFFVSVGLRVDGGAIVEAWAVVLGLLLALVLVKGPIVYALARLFGEPHAAAARAAVILAHGGEFGLLILTLALSAGVVPAAIGQPLLGAIVLSMIAAPFLIGANGRIASRMGAGTERAPAGGAVERDKRP